MTAPIRVVVVDDEPVAREGLRGLLAADPEVEIAGECSDGRAAVEAILERRPDLVLLDIQMPEMDGFEVIRAVGPQRMPAVVFVTAYDEFALRAFEVHALDYLLKPFDDERFRDALSRAKATVRRGDPERLTRHLAALLSAGDAQPPPADGGWLTRLVVRKPGASLFVPVDQIDWIESADYCVKIHAGGRVHVIREALQRLEQRLDPSRFFRAHRSALVNLDRVREVQPALHGDSVLILQDGTRVKLSRTRRSALERRLGQPL